MGNLLCCFRRTNYGENRRTQDRKPFSNVNRNPSQLNPVAENVNVAFQKGPATAAGRATDETSAGEHERDLKGKPEMRVKPKETKNRKERLEYEENILKDRPPIPAERKKKKPRNEQIVYEENRSRKSNVQYEENKKKEVEALYNYNPTNKDKADVEFRMGDRMEVIRLKGNRYYVKHKESKVEGYVHKLYVYRPDVENIQHLWYFDNIDPNEAINLLQESQEQGTFLVRDSSEGGFTINVLTLDEEQPVRKHLIQMTQHDEEEQGFHIKGSEKVFPTLDALVQACQDSTLLSIRLGKPCKNPNINDMEKPDITFDSPEPIGTGNFSKVYKGKWEGKNIAVKKIDKRKGSKSVWKKEAEIMMNFQHKNLIQCYCYYFEKHTFCIVLELMDKGSLVDFFCNENEGKLVSQHQMVAIASEIAAGMAYLEEEKLIHRDLAARNVLVGSKNEIKITDFGLARALNENPVYEDPDCPFPVQWTAPEALKGMFSLKSDVWSFGIVLFEIFSHGEPPYKDMVKNEVIMHVGRGLRLAKPEDAPEFIYDIMELCWQEKPKDRPTFKTLVDKFEQALKNDVIGDDVRENDESISKNEKESETTVSDQPFYPPTQDELEDESILQSHQRKKRQH